MFTKFRPMLKMPTAEERKKLLAERAERHKKRARTITSRPTPPPRVK